MVVVACAEDFGDVLVDLVQCGRVGHGGFVLQVFLEFGFPVAELALRGAVADQSCLGCLVAGVEGIGFERVEVLVDFRGRLDDLGSDDLEFGGDPLVAGVVDLPGGVHRVLDQAVLVAVEGRDCGEQGLVEGVCVDAVHVAGVLAVLDALQARVVAVGLGLAGGPGADHGVSAAGTGQAAGGHVVRATGRTVGMAVGALVEQP
ncbi:hypothetical protein RM788_28785 [Umezawaea sp. Da 62-37]|nr:hypothetical protein [Umezawaea sp. Da 62-37]WNV82201.1 hypothetical protein RM788_28785 [Umezawaea sp. Da 62-37]